MSQVLLLLTSIRVVLDGFWIRVRASGLGIFPANSSRFKGDAIDFAGDSPMYRLQNLEQYLQGTT